MPVRVTSCGPPDALSAKLRTASFAPPLCGAKSIETVQLAEVATAPLPIGHELFPAETIPKLAASGPVMAIWVIASAALP